MADATVVPLYNAGHPHKRRPIDREGDRTDWFSVTTSVLREMLASRGLGAEADRCLFQADFSRVDSKTFLSQRRVIQHVQRDDPADALFVEESVIRILDQVLADYRRVGTTNAKPQHRELAESARAHLNLTRSQTRWSERACMRAPVLRISSLPCVPGILWAHDSSVSEPAAVAKVAGIAWRELG